MGLGRAWGGLTSSGPEVEVQGHHMDQHTTTSGLCRTVALSRHWVEKPSSYGAQGAFKEVGDKTSLPSL